METKPCSSCRRLLPRTAKFFHRHAKSPDGLKGTCKECHKASRSVFWSHCALTWHARHALFPQLSLCSRMEGPGVYIALEGQYVNCHDCRKVIKHCRRINYYRNATTLKVYGEE